MPMLEEAIANIRSAIEAGRTDILRALIEACEECKFCPDWMLNFLAYLQ